MILFAAFIAEALVPVLLFYGLSWWLLRPGPAQWGVHLILIVATCVGIAVLRYGSAFVYGGGFALNAIVYWAFFAPAVLSFSATLWLRRRLQGARLGGHPEPATAAGPPPTKPQPLSERSSGEILAIVVGLGLAVIGLLSLLISASRWLIEDEGVASQSPQPQTVHVEPVGSTRREIVDPFRRPHREIVDPFKTRIQPPGPLRDADPAWHQAYERWSSENAQWLAQPWARYALRDAIQEVDREGGARSYHELLVRAHAKALKRNEGACPEGTVPHPSIAGVCWVAR